LKIIQIKEKNMKEKNNSKKENTTMYGEQVCSEFVWLPMDKQKENANRLNNITQKKENNGKKS